MSNKKCVITILVHIQHITHLWSRIEESMSRTMAQIEETRSEEALGPRVFKPCM